MALAVDAQAACSALTAQGFEGFVGDAMSAIDDDDLVRHGAVFRAMQEQLPCLDSQVPTDAWAEFLVGFAVVEYAMGREWEHAMDSALRIHPSVPREFGPVEVRSYASNLDLEPAGNPALPTDAEFYVDGKQVTREPALGKLHIVQRKKDGVWSTFLLQGQPWPEEWKAPKPVVEPEGPTSLLRASVFAVGGLAAGSQTIDGASALLSDASAAGALVGLGTFGDYGPGGPVGLFWDVTAPLGLTGGLGNGMGIEAYGGGSLFLGPAAVELGAGMTSVGVEDDNGARPVIVPQPRLGARLVQPLSDGLDLDLMAGGGAVPSGWHGRLHAGVRGGGSVGWNAGLLVSGNGAWLVENVERDPATAAASAWRVGLRGGVSFGS